MSGRSRRLAALDVRMARLERPTPDRPLGPAPYPGTILDAMTDAGMTGPSWSAWRTFWRAVFALPMDAADLEVFRRHTGRVAPPAAPVREVFQIIGRRGGKTRNAALAALWLGCRRNYAEILAPGERALIVALGADRAQAGQVLGYLRGLAESPAFARYVSRTLSESVLLTTRAVVEVRSASYRTTRGYTIAGIVADELAFWRTEDSANPDTEILHALRPGMATVPGALLAGLSTPYSRRGELFRAWERFYGRDAADVLVWVSDTRSMNPTIDPDVIERAYEADALAAAAEYGAEWRRDVEAFLTPEAVAAVTVAGRFELAPRSGVRYVAFTDPSGGSQDSWTLALAHREGERAVLDCVREVRPPFSPDATVAELAATLRAYRLSLVSGDRYAGEFPRELFRRHGVDYRPAEQTKGDLYREVLPLINAGRAELLDHGRLRAQLLGLERRVARGGKDSVDHAPGAHDDLANSAAGALVLAGTSGRYTIGGKKVTI